MELSCVWMNFRDPARKVITAIKEIRESKASREFKEFNGVRDNRGSPGNKAILE